MKFLYLIFYACLRLRFLDVETNPGPLCLHILFPLFADYYVVMCGAMPGTLVT